MDEEIVKRHINILNEMTECIEERLSCAVVNKVDDLYDTEFDVVVRHININRGTSNYQIAFNWSGFIEEHSKKMPVHMIVDIHNAICGVYLKGILDELMEERSIDNQTN